MPSIRFIADAASNARWMVFSSYTHIDGQLVEHQGAARLRRQWPHGKRLASAYFLMK